jgi:hypothetical protein
MLVVNTIFIGLIGFSYSNEFRIPVLVRQALPALGIILCFLWFQMTKRGFMWIKFWISEANKIEKKYKDKKDMINPVLDGDEYRKLSTEPFTTKPSAYLVIGIFLIIYLLTLTTQNSCQAEYKNLFCFTGIMK